MPKRFLNSQTFLEAACEYIETQYGIKINEISANGLLQLLYKMHVEGFDFEDGSFELIDKYIGKYLLNNESKFFRFPEQLSVLSNIASNNNFLNIISFGCSAGQEAYSAAIVLNDLGVDYNILGIDIDHEYVNHARNAVYTEHSLTNIDDKRLYFDCDNSYYYLKNIYKNNVEFVVYNILNNSISNILSRGKADIIFCNNVLIYLTGNAQNVVVNQLHSALKYGGILFTTYEESGVSELEKVFKKNYHNESFYFQKPDYNKLFFMDYRDLFEDEDDDNVQMLYDECERIVSFDYLDSDKALAEYESGNYKNAFCMYYRLLKEDSFNKNYIFRLYAASYNLGYISESKKWLKSYIIAGDYSEDDLEKYLDVCLKTKDYLEYLRIMEKKARIYYNEDDIKNIIKVYYSIGQKNMAREFEKMLNTEGSYNQE